MTEAPLPDPADSAAWRRRWVLAGPAAMLAEDGSHVTVDVPELSLTVQNFRGRLAAFWNVCSHRAVQMRCAGAGSGVLRCPYHGWAYDGDGVPVGIPENALFYGLDRAARQRLALRPAAIARAGGLVFLSGEGTGAPPPAVAPVIEGAVVLHRSARRAAPPSPTPGTVRSDTLSIERLNGWTLLLDALPAGADGVDCRAWLCHPDGAPVEAAPRRFRAALEAIER